MLHMLYIVVCICIFIVAINRQKAKKLVLTISFMFWVRILHSSYEDE